MKPWPQAVKPPEITATAGEIVSPVVLRIGGGIRCESNGLQLPKPTAKRNIHRRRSLAQCGVARRHSGMGYGRERGQGYLAGAFGVREAFLECSPKCAKCCSRPTARVVSERILRPLGWYGGCNHRGRRRTG